MNIYGKLAKARIEFHAKSLTKSGHNKFAGYNYFELGDFIPHALKCLADNGLCTVVSYTKEVAMMRVFESDGTASIELTSPMSSVALKGCHDVQNLGAVQTYLRRYLWVSLMEIIRLTDWTVQPIFKSCPKRPHAKLQSQSSILTTANHQESFCLPSAPSIK